MWVTNHHSSWQAYAIFQKEKCTLNLAEQMSFSLNKLLLYVKGEKSQETGRSDLIFMLLFAERQMTKHETASAGTPAGAESI